jgi:hypothetical protein
MWPGGCFGCTCSMEEVELVVEEVAAKVGGGGVEVELEEVV